MISKKPEKPSKVEVQKEASNYLRGSIADTLQDPRAAKFEDQDTNVLKFHGIYQQYDRDVRRRAKQSKTERQYTCMVRVRVPGGILNADQWLTLDRLARLVGLGSLRVTTRQSLQFHGILTGDVRTLLRALDRELLTTLAACGDVMRNVMSCPAILPAAARTQIQDTALEIAEALAPKTKAYHEIWLDGERLRPGEGILDGRAHNGDGGHCGAGGTGGDHVEPSYGKLYLPRKFKVGIALPDDNCVDVYTQDLGLIAIVDRDGDRVEGYHVLVGGGLGMTHRKDDTFARLGSPIGTIAPGNAVDTVRTAVEIFRDFGNREDRRHARLKYVIEERGLGWFMDEFGKRAGFELHASPGPDPIAHHDHLGWTDQGDGTYTYGLFVENGRLVDTVHARRLSGIQAVVETLRPGVRLTGHQNILFTHVHPEHRDELIEILRDHRVPLNEDVSRIRLNSMACPALPTCGLALGDAERALPGVLDDLEPLLEELGLEGEDIGVRMTGCPNGCARPYTADIAFVARAPGVYGIYAGGGLAGDRLADLVNERVDRDEIPGVLRPILARYAAEREPGEGFGDYWQRKSGRDTPRTILTGSKVTFDPTVEGVPLVR